MAAYAKCLALRPHAGAHANLGRLMHLQGRISEALVHYRAQATPDAVGWFNRAVALEDLGVLSEALAAYESALSADPEFADAHFNAAGVSERLGDHRGALRHLAAHRRLTRIKPGKS